VEAALIRDGGVPLLESSSEEVSGKLPGLLSPSLGVNQTAAWRVQAIGERIVPIVWCVRMLNPAPPWPPVPLWKTVILLSQL
jgi:hypothetical protein